MQSPPVISIIGRPNVGKSSLFNRIIGRRLAVVDDMPGITRDRNYATAQWNGEKIVLIDTGGLIPADHSAIPAAIYEQVRIAIAESAVVLFLVDAKTGPVDADLQIARMLRRNCAEKVLCVANKADSIRVRYETEIFRSLGLGAVYPVSALHGIGVADMLDRVVQIARMKGSGVAPAAENTGTSMRLAVIGRPNAGKSSLVNMLLHKKRMIVDEAPGTTRDSVDSEMTYHGKRITLIDTAGLRKKSHVKHDMEYYTNLRALESIERCDVCALMVDTCAGIGVQDLRILRKVIELRKGVLLAWNKWDLIPKDHTTFDRLAAQTRRQYRELQFIPIAAISALTGQRVITVIETALKVKENLTRRVGASEFEDNFFSWVRLHPHPAVPHNPVRFLGAKQVTAPFPLFRIFATNHRDVAPSYHRYLVNKIHETYDFSGCPVVLDFRPAHRCGQRGNAHRNRHDNSSESDT